jgi:glutamyl-tRNA synthetase
MTAKSTAKPIDSVRVRMAPSPTGPLHIGSARTALFNWLFARKHGGVFLLRIEDTDKERSKKEFEQEIFDGFHWLGIDWDEEVTRQSERTALYRAELEKLLAAGDAYYCYCTKEDLEAQRQAMLAAGMQPKYNGHCRIYARIVANASGDGSAPGATPPAGLSPQVIRFKVPEIKVDFKDIIRGKVVFDAALFGDQVIAKDLNSPLYNFAVVVDDNDMKITHVIRGEEHLGNTPKQILLQRALGYAEPIYAHIPLILNPDRSKMSKRFGDSALSEFRVRGYLSEAIVNFIALLGWHPRDDREVLNINELISEFELERVQKAGAVFDQDKLDWLNREHMKAYSTTELAARAKPFIENKFGGLLPGSPASDNIFIERLVAVERTRANTLSDFAEVGGFFFKLPDYEPRLLIWKEMPLKDVEAVLEKAYAALDELSPDSFVREPLAAKISTLIGDGNRGTVLWPLRVAVSGQQSSPDPIDIMEVLGKKESLIRIKIAIEKLNSY